MSWYETVRTFLAVGRELLTPGRGPECKRAAPFRVSSVDSRRITVKSGRSSIPLDRECFDTLESSFHSAPGLWLRVASLRGEPLEGSADELIRRHTGSALARANYVCSILVHCNLVRYAMRGNTKGIQLRSEVESIPEAKASSMAFRPGSGPPTFTANRIAALVGGFRHYLGYFAANIKFSGPSVYFHVKTIGAVREAVDYRNLLDDTHFCEYLYATLCSWGMHRMGRGGAKMVEFDEFRNSIRNAAECCSDIHHVHLQRIADADLPSVKDFLGRVFDTLVAMRSKSRLVGNSKVMHHLLPDLVPPIDREHTLQFFFGNKGLTFRDEKALFFECFDYFREIAVALRDTTFEFQGFNSSLPKIIDNAIMGYVMATSTRGLD